MPGSARLQPGAAAVKRCNPENTRTKTASLGRATERRRISAARSGLQHAVTINLALTRQAKILLPLRGSRIPNSRRQAGAWRSQVLLRAGCGELILMLQGCEAPVAQLDRAPAFEAVGHRFEPCRAR
jgi:hypothetical protein